MSASPTRFKGLGFRKEGPGLWRFVDEETDASIGPQFSTKAELMGNVAEFAAIRGFTEMR